jgi:hypothetical protein
MRKTTYYTSLLLPTQNSMDEIWGDEDITESDHHFESLAKEGFRHGKLSSQDDASRQAGFNSGFNIGRAVGRLSGNFLVVLNHPEISKLINESSKEVLISLSPDSMEEDFQKLDGLLAKSPESVMTAYFYFKSDIRKVFSNFSS